VFTGSIKKLENMVESEYMDKLRNACHKERIAQASMLLKAKYSNNQQLRKKAAKYTTASCQLLEHLPGEMIEKQFRDFYQKA